MPYPTVSDALSPHGNFDTSSPCPDQRIPCECNTYDIRTNTTVIGKANAMFERNSFDGISLNVRSSPTVRMPGRLVEGTSGIIIL